MSLFAAKPKSGIARTFFANQTVIPVVRIISVAKTAMRILELEEFVAMLA